MNLQTCRARLGLGTESATMRCFRLRATARVLLLLLAAPALAQAPPAQPPSQAEAASALNPAPSDFSRAQLDQMLAPIALYPDQLLMQLLMAATFPQQVVEASQWLQDPKNAALKGDELVAALQPLPWDPSAKSLLAFPQIITMMADHLDWTEALGIAFANQQIETMACIQFLRDRAAAAGQLKSTPQLAVQREGPEIVIEPAEPAMVYVPVYNPAEAYGEWPDADYPPVYIPPPPDFYAGAVGAGIGFTVGFGVVGPLWGWGHPDWRHDQVVVDPSRYSRITGTAGTPGNGAAIEGGTWHRTAPVALVPEPARPRPPAARTPQPPGTVTSTAVVVPRQPEARPGSTPTPFPVEPGVARPSGEPPAPHPAEPAVAHPPGGAPEHPAEPAFARPPGGAPEHPAEPAFVRPPGGAPEHPAEPAFTHPPGGAPPPHPSEEPAVAHPPAGAPPAPHPREPAVVHPPGVAPPAPHPQTPTVIRPAPAAPGSGGPAAPHPPEARAPAAGSPPPAKKPPPKPGEHEEEEHR